MHRRRDQRSKAPLCRKVDTVARGVDHQTGGDYAWSRNGKAEKLARDEGLTHGSMGGRKQRGLDYTPLFRFLLSKVGEPWDQVHAEAVARLDRSEPIFWLVALRAEDRRRWVRVGESSYWSGMHVDDDGRLALVDPSLTVDDLFPACPCCTHTLNGIRFTQGFSADTSLSLADGRAG